jgi:hypothetical protein
MGGMGAASGGHASPQQQQQYQQQQQQQQQQYQQQQPQYSSRAPGSSYPNGAGYPGGAGAPQQAPAPHPFVPGLPRDFVPFHNTEPRTREVRRAQTDKETLEKQRLKARTGGFHKYDEHQTITGYEEGTPGHVPEAARFDTDAAGMEFERRQAALQSKHAMWETKRLQQMEREDERWRRMDEAAQKEHQQWQRYRDENAFGKKNIGSVPYNAITLMYNEGRDGEELRFNDEVVRYRAALRAQRLQKNNMGEGINPLTGEKMELSSVPPIPSRESVIRQQKERERQARLDVLQGTDLASKMRDPYEPGAR